MSNALLGALGDNARRIEHLNGELAQARGERRRLIRQALPERGPSYRKAEVYQAAKISRSQLHVILSEAGEEAKPAPTVVEALPAVNPAPRRKSKARPKPERLAGMPGHRPNCKCGACAAARAA